MTLPASDIEKMRVLRAERELQTVEIIALNCPGLSLLALGRLFSATAAISMGLDVRRIQVGMRPIEEAA